MKNVELLLITYANKVYHEKFITRGFNVIEFALPLSDESISKLSRINFKGTAVIELIEDSMQSLEELILRLSKNSVRIIVISAKISDSIRKFLLKHGIAEVLETNSAGKVSEYLVITRGNVNKKYGRIIVLEDNVQRINILDKIISSFNYNPVIVGTIDKLFEELAETNIQLLFVNLGISNFDIKYFLRKSLSSDIIKRLPVILYKDMIEGIFIHEMISGINKIAKFILSENEVYSFLVNILFRKELSPGLNLLNDTLDYSNIAGFANEQLSRIYYTMGPDIFKMKKIIGKEALNIIEGRIEALNNLMIKVEGLKWLIND